MDCAPASSPECNSLQADFNGTVIGLCLEWFLYGLYSAIFATYIKCQWDKSRKATTVFYALCILYVLSTATIVCDLVIIVLQYRLIYESKAPFQFTVDSRPIILHLGIVQTLASGCCDFIAQCIMIYRCWIVWDQNIHVVIIPSFLAIAYIATWLGSDSQYNYGISSRSGSPTSADVKWAEGSLGINVDWVASTYLGPPPLDPLIITSFALSMAVNTLVTGLIVLKILKVFLEVKRLIKPTTMVEQTLGSLSTGGTKLRPVIFIIIESGMALFAIQLVRVVLSCLPLLWTTSLAFDLTVGINQMFNGIAPTIILVRVAMKLSFYDKESFMEAAGSICFNNPPSDPNTHTLRRVGSSSSMQIQETRRSEDISFNNTPSNPNTLLRMGSSSMPLHWQERSEA